MAQARDKSRAARFLLAGCPGVILYYLTFYTLTDLVGLWYVISTVPAFALNWLSNFFIQKYWTFKNRDTKNRRKQMGQHFLLAVGMLITNVILLYALTHYIGLWYLYSQGILTVLLTTLSYAVSRKIFPPEVT